MKLTIACILTVALFAAGAVLTPWDNAARSDSRTFGPQGELREIIVWGVYTRESEKEIRDTEDYLRNMHIIRENESVLHKFPHSQLGKERYYWSGQRFCDHATDEEEKRKYPVINPNLRVRLYDTTENVLSEDVLRDEFPENTEEAAYEWQVIAHVPYHAEGDSLRLVRLEKGKEILLERLEFHSPLKLWGEVKDGEYHAYFITNDGCFLSPPIR